MAYAVPRTVFAIAQQTSSVCWATVYAMMKSWRDQRCFDPGSAVASIGAKYLELYRNNQVLPTEEFGPFIRAAGMEVEPMQNKTVAAWEKMLRNFGPLWVGTLNSTSPNAGLHSRIIHAISGDGTAPATRFSIVDPDGGRKYTESLTIFALKYEGAYRAVDGEYFQIRHFTR